MLEKLADDMKKNKTVSGGGGSWNGAWLLVTQLCLMLCDPMDYNSPPGSSVHGIPQARILERVAISFSRGPSWPRDGTWVSRIAGRFFTIWASRETGEECPKSPTLSFKINTSWGCNVQHSDYSWYYIGFESC